MPPEEFDVERASELLHAIEQWKRGDSRAIAAFVLRFGVVAEDERRAVADMLTTKPDARRGAKTHTEKMLRDVIRAFDRRKKDLQDLDAYVERLRRRLSARDWTDAEINQALHERRYLNARDPTNAEIFQAVAERHDVTSDAVEKALKRSRLRRAGGDAI